MANRYEPVPRWVWTSVISAVIAAAVAAGVVWLMTKGSTPSASPAATTTQTTAPTASTSSAPGPTSEQSSSSSSAAPAACGPDEGAALSAALGQFPVDPATGWAWDSHPLDSNYDPCAELSTILVTVQQATGDSPVQALMFHRGSFLGTGTTKAYGHTSLNRGVSTGDTVVLSYRTGQSCSACDDGTVSDVRYHWDGNRVQMLDPAPPQ